MDKKEVMNYILEQYLVIEPYRDLLGDGISPIIDCLIDNWERMGVMAGFTENEAEYMVEGIMQMDYIGMAQFCQKHNIKYEKPSSETTRFNFFGLKLLTCNRFYLFGKCGWPVPQSRVISLLSSPTSLSL